VPIIAPVHSDIEIETAISALGREPGGGLVLVPDGFTSVHRALIILAAAQNNVPAVYAQPYFARDGGLLSYGFDQVDIWRRAATYVDEPQDRQALGLTVKQSILLRADEIIE
jgi:putative ABC transport system substrate-binding protein